MGIIFMRQSRNYPCSATSKLHWASCSDQIHPSNKYNSVRKGPVQIIPRQTRFLDGGPIHQSNKLPHTIG